MEETTTKEDQQSPNELEELKKKADEYLNSWKRAAADLANYKKGEIERAGLLVGYAKEGVFLSLLPIIDSMYMASAAFGKEGFMQIEKQIEEFLKKEGISAIEAVGKPFDPNTMEILAETEGTESGIVAEELQKGYIMGDKILRPAKVKVTK